MEQQEAELANEVRQSEVALEAVNRQHLQELEQRDLQLAKMRGTVKAIQNAASRSDSNRPELLDPKILHKAETFDGQRASWQSFEFQ